MNRKLALVPSIVVLVFGAVALDSPRTASAQQGFSDRRNLRTPYPSNPTVSPYISLLDQRNTGLPNYQTRVQPQLEQDRRYREQAASQQRLQRQVEALSSGRGGGGRREGVRDTGHQTFFGNLSHYYARPAGRR